MRKLLLAVLVLSGVQELDAWRIVFRAVEKDRAFVQTKSVREDGADLREESRDPFPTAGRSPDGKRRVITLAYSNSTRIAVCNVDGSEETPITDESSISHFPSWTPQGRIIFASNRSGTSQIWIMDGDGKNPVRLTDHPGGATRPKVCGDRVSYLQQHPQPREKLPPTSLRTMDFAGGDPRVQLEKVRLLDHEWNPKGDRLACSLVQELLIIDVSSRKSVKSFKLGDIHKDLHAHAAYNLVWRPDGNALACTINFLGGRTEGTTIFGDNQMFVLPLEGKPTVIELKGCATPYRWSR